MSAKALLVLGMHRSGTSALTRVLNLCGLPLGNDFVPASSDNPRGFWEHREVVDIHERLLTRLGHKWASISPMPIDWRHSSAAADARRQLQQLIEKEFSGQEVWGVKDPRLCRLIPMWVDLLADIGVEARFLFVVRDPREVVESMWQRDRRAPSIGEMLWIQHLIEPERATRLFKRAITTYDELLGNWQKVIARVEEQLEISLPVSAKNEQEVARFLDLGMRHHSYGDLEAPREGSLVSTLYDACLDSRKSRRGWRYIAEIGDRYEQGIAIFGDCLSKLSELVEFSEDIARDMGIIERGADATAYIRDLQASFISRQDEAKHVWSEKEWFREQSEVLRNLASEREILVATERTKLQSVEEEKQRLHDRLERLHHQQSELERALVGERTKLQLAEEEKQRLYDRLERLQHQQSELEKALVGERTKLQSAEEEKQRLHDRLERLQHQQSGLENTLVGERTKLQLAEEEKQRLHDRLERLQHQQSELEKALVGERTKLQSAEEEKQRLHDRLEGLQYQQLELGESLAAEKSEHEALHRDHQILLRRCEDLEGELNSLQELHGAATTAYKAVLDRPLSLKERLLGRREGFSNVTVVRQGGE